MPKETKISLAVHSTDIVTLCIRNPNDIIFESQGTGGGYVWIQTEETFLICYLMDVNNMEDDIKNIQGQIFLVGEVNAKAL